MSLTIAISCKDNKAYLFAGKLGAGGRPTLTDIRTLDIPERIVNEDDEQENDEVTVARLDLDEVFKTEVDSTAALLNSDQVLFEKVILPFSDPKNVEKVLPLQIQDKIPFDIDEFVFDSYLSNQLKEDKFEHLSSFVPKTIVEESLKTFSHIGLEPSFLTNNSFALAGIADLAPEAFTSSFAIIDLQPTFASIVILFDKTIFAMRELSASTSAGAEQLMADLRCTISQAELSAGKSIEKVFLVGNQAAARSFSSSAPYESMFLDLNSLLPGNISGVDLNSFPGALGLLAHETTTKSTENSGEINFRQGEFAYKPTFRNIMVAVQEHFWNIAGALILGLILLSSKFLFEYMQLERIDRAIEQASAAYLPGETLTKGVEKSILANKVAALEEKLQDRGSLSALSPLESLKELSKLITPTLDTQIKDLIIEPQMITINGSLGSIPAVGKLDQVLKKSSKFCDKSKPSATTKGSNYGSRTGFEAKIPLCE